MNIGQKIKKRRLELNLTQKEVAKAAGITEATLSRYENNQRIPPADILKRIANVLKINMDYFVETTSEENRDVNFVSETKKGDIENTLRDLMECLENSYLLPTLDGEPVREKTKEYLKESFELILKYAKIINKKG